MDLCLTATLTSKPCLSPPRVAILCVALLSVDLQVSRIAARRIVAEVEDLGPLEWENPADGNLDASGEPRFLRVFTRLWAGAFSLQIETVGY